MKPNNIRESKNKKLKKAVITLATTSAISSLPLALFSGSNESESATVTTVEQNFIPDVVVDANRFDNKKEYENVTNKIYGFSNRNDYGDFSSETTKNNKGIPNAERLVKFANKPSQDDWNKDEQTWELIYESGTLTDGVMTMYANNWWKNEYVFGTRTYGFALSNDLEIVPGTLSIKMEYMGTEDYETNWPGNNDDLFKIHNETDRRRHSGYDAEGTMYDTNEYVQGKHGLYLRFNDKNGKFDSSADQNFNLWPDGKKDTIDNYIVRDINSKGDNKYSYNFPLDSGSLRKGNWMYGGDDKSSFFIPIIPEIGGERPGVDGLEIMTTDKKDYGAANNWKSFAPYDIGVILTRTQIPDWDEKHGYNRYFGMGAGAAFDPKGDQEAQKVFGKNYNPLENNIGTYFAFNYYSALDSNRYSDNIRPIPLTTIKFKTRKKYNDVMIGDGYDDKKVEHPDGTVTKEREYIYSNAYLDKKQKEMNQSSFVMGLIHSDKPKGNYFRDKEQGYVNPKEMGNSNNQHFALNVSYADRTFNRGININLTEKLQRREEYNDEFPTVTGYEVYKDGNLIDTLTYKWENSERNNAGTLERKEFKATLRNFKLNTEHLNDLNGITLKPIMDQRGDFSYDVKSSVFKFDEATGTLTGNLSYTISKYKLAKDALDDKLLRSQWESALLYNDTQLTTQQKSAIRNEMNAKDWFKPRFDGETQYDSRKASTLYSTFWQDLIKHISQLNYYKNKKQDLISLLDGVNYRLSDNKAEIDKLLAEITKESNIDLDNLKVNIQNNGEVLLNDNIKIDPKGLNLDEKFSALKKLIAEMNGQSNFDKITKEIDAKLELIKKNISLYNLASNLDNKQIDSSSRLLQYEALVENTSKLEGYLHDVVLNENTNVADYKALVNKYLDNYARYQVIESFVANIRNKDSKEYKQITKLLGYGESLGENLLDEYNLDILIAKINDESDAYSLNPGNDPKIIPLNKQIETILYMWGYYSDYEGIKSWYDPESGQLNEDKIAQIKSTSLSNFDTSSYLSDFMRNVAIRGVEIKPANNIYEFIEKKIQADENLADKLKKILKENNFNYLNALKNNAQSKFNNSSLSQEFINELFTKLQGSLENISKVEDIVLLNNSGYLDALYNYFLDKFLVDNNKLYLAGDESKASEAKVRAQEELETILNALQEALKQLADKETLIDSTNFLTTLVETRIKLGNSKALATKFAAQSLENNKIKTDLELSNILDQNFFVKVYKEAVNTYKEKVKEFTYYPNNGHQNKDKFIKEYEAQLDKTIASYVLTKERIKSDPISSMLETDPKVASLGDIFALDLNKSSSENSKAMEALVESENDFIDEYYRSIYDSLEEFDKAIKAFKEAAEEATTSHNISENIINKVNNEAEGLDNAKEVISLQSSLEQFKKDLQKLQGIKEDFLDIEKIKKSNNYKFSDDKNKNDFDKAYAEFEKEYNEIVGYNSELNNKTISSLDERAVSLYNTWKDKEQFKLLNGDSNLEALNQQIDQSNYTLFDNEEGKKLLKDYLPLTSDIAEARNTVAKYNQLEEQITNVNNLVNVDQPQVIGSRDYLDADKSLKDNYDNTVASLKGINQQSKELINSLASQGAGIVAELFADATPNEEASASNSLIAKYSKAQTQYANDKKALNGEEKLKELIKEMQAQIDGFTHISQELKDTFKEEIGKLNSTADVDSKFEKYSNINNAYGTAINELSNLNNLINGDGYKALTNQAEKASVDADIESIKPNFNETMQKGIVNQNKEAIKAVEDKIKEISQVINNKYKELQQLKATKVAQLATYQNLSEKQSEELAENINEAKTFDDINSAFNKAQPLDTAMKALADAISIANEVKKTNKYILASETPKNAFDALTSENMLSQLAKEKQTSLDASGISKKSQALVKAEQALDGDAEFEKLVNSAINEIKQLENLSSEQISKAEEIIKAATTKEDLDSKKSAIVNFDKAIGDATSADTTANKVKTTPNYKEADLSKKSQYDQAKSALEEKLDSAKANANLDDLATAVKELTNAKEALENIALDGDTRLEVAKNQAKKAIESLANIDVDHVKKHYETLVEQKTSIEEINEVKATATQVDTAAKTLKDQVNTSEALVNDPKYNLATSQAKNNLQQALNNAKAVLDETKLLNDPTQNVDQLNDLKEKLAQASQLVNEQAEKVFKAQKEAIEKINKLEDLTPKQKEEQIAEVKKAKDEESIDQQVKKAEELDKATKELKDKLQEAKASKENDDYKLADEQNQKALDDAINVADKALINQLEGKSKEEIQKLQESLATAINGLNGSDNLSNAKETANKEIEKLENISKKQKEDLEKLISKAKTPQEANEISQKGKVLNDAIKSAEETQKGADEAKKTTPYTEASAGTKIAFEKSKDNLDKGISAAKEVDLSNGSNPIEELVSDLTSKVEDTKTKQGALDGESQLQAKKDSAKDKINELVNLSNEAKESLKGEIQGVNTSNLIQPIVDKGTSLDKATSALKENLNRLKELQNKPSAANFEQGLTNEISATISEAEELLDNNLLKDNKDSNAVTSANEKLQNAIDKAQKALSEFESKKTKAKSDINNLANLSSKQKEELNKEVDNATTQAKLDEAIEKATELNNSMGTLITNVAELDKQVASNNYKFASVENQSDVNALTNNGERDKLNKEAITITNKDDVNDLAERISQAIAKLDGTNNLETAKGEITNLNNLSSIQKEKAKTLLENTANKAELDAKKSQVVAFDSAISQSESAKTDAESIKEQVKYKQADDSKKATFDEKLSDLSSKLANAKNDNELATLEDRTSSLTQVHEELITAKEALNGTNNLETNKAKINALDHISQGVKDSYIRELESKSTLEEANKVVEKATKVNQSTKTLKDIISQVETDKTEAENHYDLASDDTLSKVETALSNAKEVLEDNKLKVAKESSELETLANVLDQANTKALKEASDIHQARENAKAKIQELSDLTNTQKEEQKAEVDKVKTLQAINEAFNNANALNLATKELKDKVNSANEAKNDNQYKLATPELQNALDTAIKAAQDAIEAELSNKSKDDINALKANIQNSLEKLDGSANLENLKAQEKAKIDDLGNLTPEQKSQFRNKIDEKNDPSDIQALVNNADKLDKAIAQAQKVQTKASEETKSTIPYKEASEGTKTPFDNALSDLGSQINIAKGQIPNPDNVDQLINDLKGKENALTTATNNLDGQQQLDNAKQQAKDTINALDNLSDEAKKQFTDKVDNVTTMPEINPIAAIASDLDNSTKELKEKVAELEEVNAQEGANNFSEELKKQIQDALEEAKALTPSGKLVKDKDKVAVDETKEKIQSAIDEATTALKGLEELKKSAKDEIDNLQYLSSSQKTSLKGEIDKVNTSHEVTGAKSKAVALNETMHSVIDAVEKLDHAKETNAYKLADEENKVDVNNLLQPDARAKLNKEAITSTNKDEVAKIASEQIIPAIDKLNGQDNLTKAKDKIDTLDQLSQQQKNKAKELLILANSKAKLDEISTNVANLNKTISDAVSEKTTSDNIKTTSNYSQADYEKQNNFDNKLTALGQKLQNAKTNEDLSNLTKTISQLNTAKSEMETARTELDGDSRLLTAKRNGLQYIDTLANLSDDVKKHYKDMAAEKTDIGDIEEVLNTVEILDSSVGSMKYTISDADNLIKQDKYKLATPENKSELETALNNVKAIMDENVEKLTNKDKTSNDVGELDSKLRDAINNIEDSISNIEKLQKDAKTAIEELSNLTPVQKQDLKDEVENKTNPDDLEQLISDANELNQVTGELKDKIAEVEKAKATPNYELSDSDKQKDLTDSENKAKDELDKGLKGKSKEEINKLKDNLDEKLGALNGNDNLNNTKKEASEKVNGLENISPKQKEDLKGLISKAQTPTEANNIADKAKALDDAIKNASQVSKGAGAAKTNTPYVEASNDTKEPFDTSKGKLDKAITEAKETDLLNGTTPIDNLVTNLQNKATDTKEKQSALDGLQQLDNAKQQAKDTINSLENLSDEVKKQFTDKVDAVSTKAEIDPIVTQASTLDNSTKELKEKVTELEEVNAQEGANDFSEELKKQIQDVLEEAKALTPSGKLVKDKDKAIVDKVKEKVQSAIDEANAALKGLEELKKSVKDEIDKLQHLSNAQKTSLKGEIDRANTAKDITEIKSKATALDQNMDSVLKAVEKLDHAKETKAYKLSDEGNQTGVNNLLQPDARAKLNKEAITTIDKDEVAKIISEQITPALTALNGETNLENTKNSIDKLENLNKEQKDSAKAVLEGTNSKVDLDSMQNNITKFNKAIGEGNTANNQAESEKEKIAYKQADNDKKATFDAKLSNLNSKLGKAKANNALNDFASETNELEKAIKELNEAKEALNGVENLNKAKEQAAQELQDAKDALDKLIKSANKIQPKSNKLVSQIKNAQDILDNNGDDIQTIKDAIDKLQHKINTNELDLAIQEAPALQVPKYNNKLPNATAESEEVSANDKATEEEIKAATQKQNLYNKQVALINDVNVLKHTNPAQIDKYVDNVANAQDAESVTDLNQDIKLLDKNMKTLGNTYNNVDKAYKNDPKSKYEYALSTKEEQKALDDAIQNVRNILLPASKVYKDNKASQIDELNKGLTKALNNLSGKDKFKSLDEVFNDNKAKVEQALKFATETNENSLYNATNALQKAHNDATAKAQKLIQAYKQSPEAFDKLGGIEEFNNVVSQLQKADKEIALFSNEAYTNENGQRIKAAEKFLSQNSDHLKDTIAKNGITEFEKATTFAQADEILNNVALSNKEVKKLLDQAAALIHNKLSTAMDSDEIKNNINAAKANAKESKINALINIDSLADKINANQKALDNKQNQTKIAKSFFKELDKLANEIAKVSPVKCDEYQELANKANELLNQSAKQTKAFSKLANSIKNKDLKSLQEALNDLDNNNKALANVLANEPELFEIASKVANNKEINNEEAKALENLKAKEEYKNASPAIKAMLDSTNTTSANNSTLWWPFLLVISVATWLAGIASYVFGKNKK
ncbi:hypothetical protein [Mycoplasma sp. VS30B]